MAYRITDACIGCSLCKKVCPTDAIKGAKTKVHKINRDLCIDCGACGRICPQAAVRDLLENVCKRVRFRSRWEKPKIDREKCIACIICIDVCPVSCLKLSAPEGSRDSLRYPYLNPEKACIACGFCATDCPVDAIDMIAG